MFRLPHLLTAFALMGALTANADAKDLTLHKLADGSYKDFGENKGRKAIYCKIQNLGKCPIVVRYFDITAPGGKWRTRRVAPGRRWTRDLLPGEHLQVLDRPDHVPSKFGLFRRK